MKRVLLNLTLTYYRLRLEMLCLLINWWILGKSGASEVAAGRFFEFHLVLQLNLILLSVIFNKWLLAFSRTWIRKSENLIRSVSTLSAFAAILVRVLAKQSDMGILKLKAAIWTFLSYKWPFWVFFRSKNKIKWFWVGHWLALKIIEGFQRTKPLFLK